MGKKREKLKILFVEDMDADFELAESELQSDGISFDSSRVENDSDFLDALKDFQPDIVISDYNLPRFNGMEALGIAKEFDPSLPFIVLTGTLNEEIAVDCMKAGANDYVLKEHIGKLPYAVKESLRFRDVMRKKIKAEAALVESESRLKEAQKLAKVGDWEFDIIRRKISWSDQVYRMYERDLALGPPDPEEEAAYYTPEQGAILQQHLQTVINTGTELDYEFTARLKSGNTPVFNGTMKPVKDINGRVIKIFGTIQDITERKKTLEDLKKSLNEKRELIKEIYHRTKNNMQVIISMFALHPAYDNDEKLDRVLMDMENRIRTMALVHEKLYQSNNLSKLDLGEYLIELTHNIISSYGFSKDKIHVNKKMKRFDVLIDTAVPCGLVVNELVSNIAKHAFPGDKKGELTIELSIDSGGEIKLIISDNGEDYKNQDAERSDSMGLQLVKNIVEYQLKGSVEKDTDTGLKWIIKFRDNLYEKRI